MKKKDLARIQAYVMQTEPLIEHTTDTIADQLASQFSLLINIDPAVALDILEQLYEQKPKIEAALKDHTEKKKKLVENFVKIIPSIIEFDEDEEDESDLS